MNYRFTPRNNCIGLFCYGGGRFRVGVESGFCLFVFVFFFQLSLPQKPPTCPPPTLSSSLRATAISLFHVQEAWNVLPCPPALTFFPPPSPRCPRSLRVRGSLTLLRAGTWGLFGDISQLCSSCLIPYWTNTSNGFSYRLPWCVFPSVCCSFTSAVSGDKKQKEYKSIFLFFSFFKFETRSHSVL